MLKKKKVLLTFLKVLDGGSCKVIRKRENKVIVIESSGLAAGSLRIQLCNLTNPSCPTQIENTQLVLKFHFNYTINQQNQEVNVGQPLAFAYIVIAQRHFHIKSIIKCCTVNFLTDRNVG